MEKFAKELMDNALEVLKKFNVFTGRTSRRDFWMFFLAGFLVGIALAILSAIPFLGRIFSVISYIFSIGLSLLSISVGIRRLHDVDKSGKLMIPMIVGLVPMLIVQIILQFLSFRVSRANPLDYIYGSGLYGLSAAYTATVALGGISIFFGIVALVGAIIVIWFCIKEGDPGNNKYGPPPAKRA